MKINRLITRLPGRNLLAAAMAVAGMAAAPAVLAATSIEVWHALNSHNKDVFEDLVKQFNKDQKDVKVTLKSFDSLDAVEAELVKEAKGKNAPNLVQLDDHRSPDGVASRSYITPMHVLLAKYPIKNQQWYLSRSNSFARDEKGNLLAFPYMADIPVMFYNTEAFKTAGLTPTTPERSWEGLQGQLVTLANNGSRHCPLVTDQVVSMNLENLAAVNNQLYTSNNNGIGQKTNPAFLFDITYVRHLSLMISWVRSEIMVHPELSVQAAQRFADRECAVLISSSGNLGWFRKVKALDFGVSGLPYYPQVTKSPGNPFVGGSAFWAVHGRAAEQDKATAAFLGWLAEPKRAAQWYQETGFLPLTKDAYNLTLDDYYKSLGQWQPLVAVYAKDPSVLNRGFRVRNYDKIKAMFNQRLNNALKGQEPATVMLKSASTEAGKLMQQR